MSKPRRASAGFTLLEVLIAVLIVGIIATAAVPLLGSYTEKAREAREEANMEIKRKAIERYEFDHKASLGLVYDPATSSLVEYGIVSARGPSAQLLLPTDVNGNVMGDPVGASPGPFSYGPYLAELPPEPASVLLGADQLFPRSRLPQLAKRPIVAFIKVTGSSQTNAKATAYVAAIKDSGPDAFGQTGAIKDEPHISNYNPFYSFQVDLGPEEIYRLFKTGGDLSPRQTLAFLDAMEAAKEKTDALHVRTGRWESQDIPELHELLPAVRDFVAAETTANGVTDLVECYGAYEGQWSFFDPEAVVARQVGGAGFVTATVNEAWHDRVYADLSAGYKADRKNPELVDYFNIYLERNAFQTLLQAQRGGDWSRYQWGPYAVMAAMQPLAQYSPYRNKLDAATNEAATTYYEKLKTTTAISFNRTITDPELLIRALEGVEDQVTGLDKRYLGPDGQMKREAYVRTVAWAGNRMLYPATRMYDTLTPRYDCAGNVQSFMTEAKYTQLKAGLDLTAAETVDTSAVEASRAILVQITGDTQKVQDAITTQLSALGYEIVPSENFAKDLAVIEFSARRQVTLPDTKATQVFIYDLVTASIAEGSKQPVKGGDLPEWQRATGFKVGRVQDMYNSFQHNIKITLKTALAEAQ